MQVRFPLGAPVFAKVLSPLASPGSTRLIKALLRRLLSGEAEHKSIRRSWTDYKMNYFVYILKSKQDTKQIYIGYTTNLENRIEQHQDPKASAYTRQYAPWELETYVVFKDRGLAQAFEYYLKSHSGRAFLRKRLISQKIS